MVASPTLWKLSPSLGGAQNKKMNVLIACEESQRVCIEFRKRGHNAFSCDIQDPSGGHPEWHILGDALEFLNPCIQDCFENGFCDHFYGIKFKTMDGKPHKIYPTWDLIIAHPPCTYLSVAGANWLFRGGKLDEERYRKGLEAKEFFMKFLNAECDKICVENPTQLKIFEILEATQVINPYEFYGKENPYKKRTQLWLKGLEKLVPTEPIDAADAYSWVNAGHGKREGEHNSKKEVKLHLELHEQWRSSGDKKWKAKLNMWLL